MMRPRTPSEAGYLGPKLEQERVETLLRARAAQLLRARKEQEGLGPLFAPDPAPKLL